MKIHWTEKTQFIQKKFYFLNRFLVPFLFCYFILMILPQTVPYIRFLPNIFSISAFSLAYKGLLFIVFVLYFVLLSIINKIKPDWRFIIPILALAMASAIGIIFFPRLSYVISISDENVVVGIPVVIGWTTKIAAIAESLSNLFSAYVFLVILPKSLFFKKQIRQLAGLMLGFIVFASLYSLVFEIKPILASVLDADPSAIVSSFFDHKNTYGKYLMIGIFLVCYMYNLRKDKLLLLLIPFFLANLFVARCKTALAISLCFLLAMALWELFRLYQKHRKTALAIILSLASVFLVLAALLLIEPLRDGFMQTDFYKYLDSTLLNVGFETITGRLTIYRHVLKLLSDWWRVGFGYGDHIANIFLQASTSFELEVSYQTSAFHNGFLDLIAKGGILRLVAYFAAVSYICSKTAKLWKRNAFLCFLTWSILVSLGIHSLFESTLLLDSSAWGFITSICCVVIPLSAERLSGENKPALLKEAANDEPTPISENPLADEEKRSNRRIGKGALVSYIAIIFVAITGFLINPWLIKSLGSSRYAIYSLVTSIVVMFGYDFGLEDTITRYLSKALANKDQKKANEIIGQVSVIYLVIDAVMLAIFAIVMIFADKIFAGFSASDITIFRYAFVIMALWSVVNLPFTSLTGILYSYEKFTVQRNGDIIRRVISLILLIIVLVLDLGIYWVIASQLAASVIVLAYKLVYLSEKHHVQPVFVMKDKTLLKDLVKFSSWAFIVAIIDKAMINLAPTFIGMVYSSSPDYHEMANVSASAIAEIRSGVKSGVDYDALMALAKDEASIQITFFSIATQFYYYVAEIAIVFGGLFVSKVARMKARKATDAEFNDLYVKTSRYQLAIILIFIVGFACLGKQLLTVWLGSEYLGIYWVAMLLITPIAITGPQIILNTMLSAQNEVKYRSFVYIGTFILDVALSLVLAHYWGALGAAIGYFVASLLGFAIAGTLVYKKRLHISFAGYLKKSLIPMLLPVAITLVIGLALSYIHYTGWIALAIKAVLLIFVYVLSLWIFVLHHSEKDNIIGLLDNVNEKSRDYLLANIEKQDTSQLSINYDKDK